MLASYLVSAPFSAVTMRTIELPGRNAGTSETQSAMICILRLHNHGTRMDKADLFYLGTSGSYKYQLLLARWTKK